MKCFVIAMECEAAPVSGALDEIYSEETICGLHIVYGTMCGERMFVMTCGIGKVNAGRGAQYAVSVLGADTIINIGVAGGLLPCMKVAAMYGVSGAVQYDFDLTQINGTPMGTLNECTSPILPLEKTDLYPSCIVGSGDRFNDDPKDFQLLTKELGAGIRDMELGAIAQVCMHTGTRLYSFKAISDVAGQEESTPDQYSHNQALCFETEKAEIRRIVQVCV